MSRYPQRPRPLRRAIRFVFRTLCILLFISLFAGGVFTALMVSSILRDAPALTPAMVSPASASSYIVTSAGDKQLKLTLPENNRDLVSIEHISTDLQNAFVAIEDKRFYQHNGIDLKGIARAMLRGIMRGSFSEGASTITQQLIKNNVLTGWTNETTFKERLTRKIQEQYLAIRLEKLLSKSQILEDYMNTINLGAGCYGVQAAAYRYFGKDVADLTLSECTVIAGITKNPTRYNPLTNPSENALRRGDVLSAMLSQGYISESAYQEALADDVYSRIRSHEENTSLSTTSIYTSYQDALIDQVIEDLQSARNYTYKQAVKAVYSGGLRIYTAQDDTLQEILDEAFADPANFPEGSQVGIDYALSVENAQGVVTNYGNEDLKKWVRSTSDADFHLMYTSADTARASAEAFKQSVISDGDTVLGERVTVTPQPQASVVLIDQSTGYVKAIEGGREEKSASLTLNRATSSTRQPGSTFKILAGYAPALELGGKTLADTYANTPLTFDDGSSVSNWDISGYSDEVSMREAIVRSINVAAVRCLTEITPQLGFNMLKSFGFTTLITGQTQNGTYYTDIGQALVLGGLTRGVTNLELCAAYAAIANGGRYIAPKFYTKVTDRDGNVILDNEAPPTRQILSASTSFLLTDAMKDVIADPAGTAYGVVDTSAMERAGKSGTTTDYKDIWFTGYTPYYTLSVWGGYDNNESLPDTDIFHSYAKVLWNSIMNRIDAALTPASFSVPRDIVKVRICADTHLAAAGCPDTYEEYFSTSRAPMFYCDAHGNGQAVDDKATSSRITDSAAASGNASSGSLSPDGGIVITTQDEAYIPENGSDAPSLDLTDEPVQNDVISPVGSDGLTQAQRDILAGIPEAQ